MAEPLADQVVRKVKQAGEQSYRLILVVAPAGAGKTTTLKDVQERVGAPLVNVNVGLSRRMLDLTERQRALQLPQLLRGIIKDAEGVVVLLLPSRTSTPHPSARTAAASQEQSPAKAGHLQQGRCSTA